MGCRQMAQVLAFALGLINESDMALREVAKTAMDQL